MSPRRLPGWKACRCMPWRRSRWSSTSWSNWSAAASRQTASASRVAVNRDSEENRFHARGDAMKRLLFAVLLTVLSTTAASAGVLRLTIDDTIHPITDEFVGRALEQAA